MECFMAGQLTPSLSSSFSSSSVSFSVVFSFLLELLCHCAVSVVLMDASGCSYEGDVKNGRMEGIGEFKMESGNVYVGEMKDGMFHGNGKIIFPDGGMYVAKWENGKVVSGQYIFDDKLFYGGKEDWTYSTPSDRRFHSEMMHIPPPDTSKMTNDDTKLE
eukprot:TRINITY_DN2314_c0_g1_i1.p1 TRINITY_DN2314_c0_g1~~TRINITY_DN2314_c0_g1_i1.p1  ORF type:complete len:160 (-),score=48.34 TRINITY_DN2314_c0_g1_i1:71-550(-)